MTKSVLVTGADGFIGSHLVETLVKKGLKVRAFVMYNSFNTYGWIDTLDRSIINQLEIIPGDIRDPFGVNKAIKGCDAIFHLAALIAIPYSYHSPATYIDTNIKGTLNVLQGAMTHNVKSDSYLNKRRGLWYGTICSHQPPFARPISILGIE